MLRTVLAVVTALSAPAAIAAECPFVSGTQELYFVTPALVAVADRNAAPPYACYTSSAGTGVEGRMLGCSDGFDGPLVFKADDEIEFRGSTWRTDCPDNAATDIGFGN
jgi:hypothetical protein